MKFEWNTLQADDVYGTFSAQCGDIKFTSYMSIEKSKRIISFCIDKKVEVEKMFASLENFIRDGGKESSVKNEKVE